MKRSIRRFAAELQRRRVYRAAITYAVAAFAVWLIADLAFPSLGLRSPAVRVVLIATILVFPMALVLAWISERSAPSRSRGRGGKAPWYGRPGPSVAVLPFSNLSTEIGSQHSVDGMVEELTNTLAQVRSLRVVARTSSFEYGDPSVDVREIGGALGVSHVLRGSVRRTGGLVSVTAQLVDASHGGALWSERYDRLTGDLFDVLDGLVEAVTTTLLRRRPETTEERGSVRTRVPEAYDAFLRARSAHMELDAESLSRATKLYEAAVSHDPTFALAHAGLAEALLLLAGAGGAGSPELLARRARAALDEALDLAPDLPEAHAARASLLLHHEWDFERARAEAERALELCPSSVEAHLTLERYYTCVRPDADAALRMASRACELSPVESRPRLRLGYLHAFAGRFQEAEAVFHRLLESGSAPGSAALGMADILARIGRTEEAVEWTRRGMSHGRVPDRALAQSGAILAAGGHSREALDCLRDMESRSAGGTAAGVWTGVLMIVLGRGNEGFALLEQALREHEPGLLYLSLVPSATLRADPRYAALLEKIGLGHLAAGSGAVYPAAILAPTS